MTNDTDLLRQILRYEMDVSKLSMNAWAKKAKIPESTLRNFLAGRSETLTHATIASLARAADVSVSEMLERPSGRTLNVRGEIRADEWIIEKRHDHLFTTFIPYDPRYPKVRRVGFVVADDSCDLIFRPGSILVTALHLSIPDRVIKGGDHVVIDESGDEMGFAMRAYENEWRNLGKPGEPQYTSEFWDENRELGKSRLSVREVVEDGDHLWFVFKSASPRWSKSIKFPKKNLPPPDHADPTHSAAGWARHDGMNVHIRGFVIASYRLE